MFFIDKQDIPTVHWRDVTYIRVVVNYIPENQDLKGTELNIGRDRVNYPGDCRTSAVDLLTAKLLLNSIFSTPGAKFMTIDKRKFYLNTPMECREYIRVKLSYLSEDLVKNTISKQR